jgi:hypothetical protein
MFQRLLSIVVVAMAMVVSLGTSSAEAKGVPIPCTGDRFVAVHAPAFKQVAKASGLQLAYRFSGCLGGEFVAYDGTSRYMAVPPATVAEIEQRQGHPIAVPGVVKSLFAAPGQFWVEWLYLIVIVGWATVSLFKRGSTETADVERVATAAAPAQPASAPAVAQRAPRLPSTAAGAKPTFGKLGAPARPRMPPARTGFATRKTA